MAAMHKTPPPETAVHPHWIKLLMKRWLARLNRNRYFLLFILLFAYVQSIYIRMTEWQEINAYTFTPEAALFTLVKTGVLFVITFSFVSKWQKSDVFSTREMLKIFGSSLLAYLLAMKAIGLAIALLFGTVERNFNRETFFFALFSDFLDGFIYGSFFLAYQYYNQSKNHQRQLASYHQSLAESKIHQLKSQLNPHFLFNNLNVLDQLIEEDKDKASHFLNEFAEIYRYVLQASDKKLISLGEELAFAEQYFRLIEHKYGNAYQMTVACTSPTGYIVPLTLQLLIENAVQHNLGNAENPVRITIEVTETVRASNNVHRKRNAKQTYGRALNNMREQYKLLTEKPVEIQQSETTFSVIIPIIHTKVL